LERQGAHALISSCLWIRSLQRSRYLDWVALYSVITSTNFRESVECWGEGEDRHRQSGSGDSGGGEAAHGLVGLISLRCPLHSGGDPTPSSPPNTVPRYPHPMPAPAGDPRCGQSPLFAVTSPQAPLRTPLAPPLPWRCSPCSGRVSYLGLADAQVRGGTVQPLFLFNALLNCCERKRAR
jgi:hypothetical protein